MLSKNFVLGLALATSVVQASVDCNTTQDAMLGAAASESSVCTSIATDVLKDGGNAADAIIASQFCVGVIGMYHSGVGGGGFMTVRAPNGSYEFIDFREMAPAVAFAYMYSPPYGTSAESLSGGLANTMTRKRYANTLESIAEYGPDAFYKGAIANATITALQKQNGTMALSDLANYTVQIRQVSNITYRGFKIFSGSAPSSGAVVASVLKIVEGYDMSTPSNINLSTHYLDEGMRFAYGQRTLLGDPSFLPNLTTYQKGMYSASTAAEIRSKIEEYHTLNVSAYDPSNYEILQDDGTSASVTSDKSGLTIAMTSTVNTLFGSTLMVPETGVIMNNEMNDFSIPNTTNAFGYAPAPANFIAPFKRPLSSISPTIVEYPSGDVYISHASAGGSRIITEVIQHLWHVLDQNMTSAESLRQPRMHDQLSPNLVSFEYGSETFGIVGYSNQTTSYLAEVDGAAIGFVAVGSTTAQALRVLPNGTFEAAGEPRQLNSAGFAV
ncbi:gamma-glutamyltranspeptidase [Mollisia scopiformis]|uniref:Gamma-glutamyltranspeptidase n=1 Tax=Mollisia scopiformis TaxID=149040 RepID=A0A132B914_MOLSC|nr:gamma-glutamyltranspeptidase [Mollisia scopiformis]KUJ08895.1 gamma-glutamyltranspeptidase [Mollisia scopiformis]